MNKSINEQINQWTVQTNKNNKKNKQTIEYLQEILLNVSAESLERGRPAECLTTDVTVNAVFSSFSRSPALYKKKKINII